MPQPPAQPPSRPARRTAPWRRLLPLGLAVGALHLWLLPDLRPPAATAERPAGVSPPASTAGRPVAVLPVDTPPAPQAASPATAGSAPEAGPAPRQAESAAGNAARKPSGPASAAGAPIRLASPPARPSAVPTAAPAASTPVPSASASPLAAGRPAPAAEAAPPPCPTIALADLPPPVRVGYRLQRGRIEGEGTLRWTHDGQRYQLELDSEVPLVGRLLRQRSEGRFDPCGLAPLRHTERRLGRSERALSFLRPPPGSSDGPGELRASSRVGHQPLLPGLQDRLSWLVQLAARLQAGVAIPGEQIELDVAAVGGDIQHWRLSLLAREADGLLRLRREPEQLHDTRAEVWVDPARAHWPVRVELHEARGDPLLLQMTTWETPPR